MAFLDQLIHHLEPLGASQWQMLKAHPINPQTYISRSPKIDPREGR